MTPSTAIADGRAVHRLEHGRDDREVGGEVGVAPPQQRVEAVPALEVVVRAGPARTRRSTGSSSSRSSIRPKSVSSKSPSCPTSAAVAEDHPAAAPHLGGVGDGDQVEALARAARHVRGQGEAVAEGLELGAPAHDLLDHPVVERLSTGPKRKPGSSCSSSLVGQGADQQLGLLLRRPGWRRGGALPAQRHVEAAVGPLQGLARPGARARPRCSAAAPAPTARRSSSRLSAEHREGPQRRRARGGCAAPRTAPDEARRWPRRSSEPGVGERPSSTASPASSSSCSAARRWRLACSSRKPAARPDDQRASAPTPSSANRMSSAGVPGEPPPRDGRTRRVDRLPALRATALGRASSSTTRAATASTIRSSCSSSMGRGPQDHAPPDLRELAAHAGDLLEQRRERRDLRLVRRTARVDLVGQVGHDVLQLAQQLARCRGRRTVRRRSLEEEGQVAPHRGDVASTPARAPATRARPGAGRRRRPGARRAWPGAGAAARGRRRPRRPGAARPARSAPTRGRRRRPGAATRRRSSSRSARRSKASTKTWPMRVSSPPGPPRRRGVTGGDVRRPRQGRAPTTTGEGGGRRGRRRSRGGVAGAEDRRARADRGGVRPERAGPPPGRCCSGCVRGRRHRPSATRGARRTPRCSSPDGRSASLPRSSLRRPAEPPAIRGWPHPSTLGYGPLRHRPSCVDLAPVELRQYLSVLRSRLWLILVTTLLAGGVGLHRCPTRPPRYPARSTLYVGSQNVARAAAADLTHRPARGARQLHPHVLEDDRQRADRGAGPPGARPRPRPPRTWSTTPRSSSEPGTQLLYIDVTQRGRHRPPSPSPTRSPTRSWRPSRSSSRRGDPEGSVPRLPAYVFERAQLPTDARAHRPDPHRAPGHAVRAAWAASRWRSSSTTSTCRSAAPPTSSAGSSCPCSA